MQLQVGSETFGAELLSNGLVRLRDRSGLVGCWHRDGTPAHGDLTRVIGSLRIGEAIAEAFGA